MNKEQNFFNITERQRESLSVSEAGVVEWIMEHKQEVPSLSISDIAEASYSSIATVSRSIKKCGFSGIAELKYMINTSFDKEQEGKVVNQIFQKSMIECKETIQSLKTDDLLRAANHIRMAKRIVMLSGGITGMVAQVFSTQLQMLGYNVQLITDQNLMIFHERYLRKDDLLLLYTVRGYTKELREVAIYAKEHGIPVLTCSCYPVKELKEVSDICISGTKKNHELIHKYALMSHLPLQIISRTLIEYLML